jgi:hypothetical protein
MSGTGKRRIIQRIFTAENAEDAEERQKLKFRFVFFQKPLHPVSRYAHKHDRRRAG